MNGRADFHIFDLGEGVYRLIRKSDGAEKIYGPGDGMKEMLEKFPEASKALVGLGLYVVKERPTNKDERILDV